MKKLFFITLLGLIFFVSCETDEDSKNQWIVDNVVYEKLNDTSVKVTGAQQGMENLVIPASITITMDDTEKLFKVTEIGDYAFKNNYSITLLIVPNSVVKIGEGAFYGCFGIQTAFIGYSVVEIGSYAFFSPNSINNNTRYILLPKTPPTIGQRAIDTGYVYVKEDCLESYQNAWGYGFNFATIDDDVYDEALKQMDSAN